MSSATAPPARAALRWRVSGDAFVARRLEEVLPPGRRAGAVARSGSCGIAVTATRAGIERVDLVEAFMNDVPEPALPRGVEAEAALQDLADMIARCVDRWDPDIARLPLDVEATPFQAETWRVLREIPAGRTLTYGDVARRLGRGPGASRAVGQALGSNPVPILVPCHRVLASGGRIGGFACGLALKRRLLAAEGVHS